MARQDSVFFEEVMAFLLLTTVCVSLLWQGLLYEENSIAVVILLSVFSFVVLLKARLADGLDMGQPFIAGLFLLLAAASLLSLLNAVNLHDSVYALCKNSALLLLVLALGALRQKIPLEQWLAKALTYAGVIVALIGLDGVWGGYFAGAVNAFFNSGPLMEGQDGFLFQMMLGDRLSSVFQYPNTTASFLMAAWFAACHRFVFRDVYTKPSAGKWYRRGALYTAGGANLIFLAFVLTLSRGMYLLAVPAMLLYALLLPGEGKRRSLSRFLLAFFPGFLIGVLSLPAAPLRSLHPVLGWLLLLLLFAASGFLAYALTEKAG
ncbi:MAG: hypothetical protein FWH49_08605, partial [Clostridiales bacterium]|nr:hypothetical protein [Clostridiales bacterium]